MELACQPHRRARHHRADQCLQGQARRDKHAGQDCGGSRGQGNRGRDRRSKEASAIIIAEQGRWYTAIIRPLLAFPIIIYFWKVIVWDKVLGLGSTDPITGMIADWTGTIITAYVGGRSIEKVARIFARRS